jgi:hypothetical protein
MISETRFGVCLRLREDDGQTLSYSVPEVRLGGSVKLDGRVPRYRWIAAHAQSFEKGELKTPCKTQGDGLLVPPLAAPDYSEEQIGDRGDRYTDQADEPRIAESRLICGEFSPSILFGEGAQEIMRHHIVPVARKLGITKRIGWHTFRHTYSTLLRSTGAELKIMQDLLRHSTIRVTLDIYTQAVTTEKRNAQQAVVALLFREKTQET